MSTVKISQLTENSPTTNRANTIFVGVNLQTSVTGSYTLEQIFELSDAYAQAAFLKANTPSSVANSAGNFANGAFLAANSGATFANAAFITANAAYDAQNTTASFANGAFATANASYVSQNTTATFANAAFTRANSGYGQANSAASFANGSFVTANASYDKANSNALFANGAFVTANSGASFANSAFITANAAASFANGAFLTANASYESQNTTASFANGAFITANAAFNAANNATDPWVRNQANNSYNTANGAFVTANSGASFANGAFDRANAAYAAANTGSGVGGVLTSFVDTFTANGISNNFTLSTTPTNKNITFVSIQGVLQPKESYNISGTILTFDSTPPNTAFIEITTLNGASDNAAFIAANAAFITANSGASFANAAFIQANAAFTQANTASIRYITLNETGNIVIKTGTVRFYPPSNIAINNVYASLSTTSANTFTFEVVKNGSVVGTYNIDSNTNKMTVAAANINLTSNDYLTVNITNGSQASDLRIDLEYK